MIIDLERQVLNLKNKNNLSQDELRQKVDGFSLKNKSEAAENISYKTTDQGVYYPPDDNVDDVKKSDS